MTVLGHHGKPSSCLMQQEALRVAGIVLVCSTLQSPEQEAGETSSLYE